MEDERGVPVWRDQSSQPEKPEQIKYLTSYICGPKVSMNRQRKLLGWLEEIDAIYKAIPRTRNVIYKKGKPFNQLGLNGLLTRLDEIKQELRVLYPDG